MLRRLLSAVIGGAMAVTLSACGGAGTSVPSVQSPQVSTPQNPSTSSVAGSSLQADAVARTLNATPNTNFTYHASAAHIMAPYAGGSAAAAAAALHTMTRVYPSDLSYFGGPVMTTATEINVLVDTNPSTMSLPGFFLANLNNSNMIHITDQYTGQTSNGRYKMGPTFAVGYQAFGALGDNDVLSILHLVGAYVAPSGSTTNIYNIFLAPGLNYCGTGTIFPAGACNAATGSPAPAFCGFHSALQFSDIGEMIYTMEPYQDPNYCAVNAYFPNATLPQSVQTDSQYSVLSHETFETLTDPIPGYGWYNANAPAVSGEIGDLCAYISSQDVRLNGHLYYTQAEYSNQSHACVINPPMPKGN